MRPRRRALVSVVTSLLLTAVLTAVAPGAASAAPNLIGNPGFEVDTSGWGTGATSTSLTRVAGGHSGNFAAQLSNSSAGAQCSLEDEPNVVSVTQSGPYTFSIWARSDAAGRSFKLRVREYSSGSQVGSNSTTVTLTSTWQQVSLEYTPAAAGQSKLEFQGYTSSTPVGVCFQADDASASVGGIANNLPVAVDNSATTAPDTPVTIDVLANDSDPDGDPLTVTGATTPAHGTATVNPDNTITYTPEAGYLGPDSFTYDISDGRDGTASATVSIDVTTDDNNPPVAANNSATTAFNTSVTINVLANDSDPDGDPLTVTGATTPAHGTATVNANNTITYTPALNYSGPDSFTYSISDGRGGTASATVSITVSPGNRPPVAGNNSAVTAFNTSVTINVLANDSDPDGDPLTVTGATTPAHGTRTVNANNTITYTPALNYSGPDSFTYSISDGRGGTASATVSITVNPANSTRFDFAALGDVPYSSSAVTKYNTMIANINAGASLFSVHVGDIGPGSSATCTNATVDRETARFDTFKRPLMYTPGDNEWVDCGSARLTRLSYIRNKVYRGTGTQSRGQTPISLESQGPSGYPENARWRQGPVTFATLHMVGSRDNYSNRSEFDPRRQATIAWLRATFTKAKARGDRGVVLFAQIDPSFSDPTASAYRSMYDAVRQETLNFNGQVLFVHGDGHDYISDRPLTGVSNLRRVQVEGDGKVSYVKVRVDPSLTQLFVIPQPTRF